MAGKFQDEGVKLRLEAMRSAWNTTPVKLKLFKNDYTPTTSSVLGDFTEADFTGYAEQSLATWGAAAVTAHVGTITAAANTFTRSATGTAQNIYGYYVTDSGHTKVYWAERFTDAPRTVTNNGDTITVTDSVTDKDVST